LGEVPAGLLWEGLLVHSYLAPRGGAQPFSGFQLQPEAENDQGNVCHSQVGSCKVSLGQYPLVLSWANVGSGAQQYSQRQEACLVVRLQTKNQELHTGAGMMAVTALPHPCSDTCQEDTTSSGAQASSPSSVASTVRLCQTRASRSRDTAVRMVPSSGSMEKQRSGSEWGRMEYLGNMGADLGAATPPSLPSSVHLAGLMAHLGSSFLSRVCPMQPEP
jgi:hypothetical protein